MLTPHAIQAPTSGPTSFPGAGRRLRCLAWLFASAFAGLHFTAAAEHTVQPEKTAPISAVHRPLRQLTGERLTLRGADDERRIHLGVRLDEMVVRGHLNLAITPSPALLPNISHLQVRLNDKLLAVVPMRADPPGDRIARKIDLDPRLFLDDNWLSLRLVAHYTLACEDPFHGSLWADVDVDATGFELAIQPLALEDELDLFPTPWFDRRSGGRLEVPVVLGEQPSHDRLVTAAVMASWLGALAGERGAVFPVQRNRLPDRHAIVLATPQHRDPEGLELPDPSGPTVRVMRHPTRPHVKLLVLQGRTDQELRTAALGLILGRQAMSGRMAQVHAVAPIPVRAAYDAPNWVATDRPVRLGELVPDRAALQLSGTHPDDVRVHWRPPPDLWQGPGRAAQLDLSYRVSVPSKTENALMSLSLNDSFVRAWRVSASPANESIPVVGKWLADTDEASGAVRVKLPEFQPGQTNTLEVRLPLGVKSQAGDCAGRGETTRASVDAGSMLDFSALPHFLEMPDLAAFAGSGFPFTKYADLAQTAIVLPPNPDDNEIETLLAVMGSFGRWTGVAAWHVEITTPEDVNRVSDRDLLLIGGERLHTLLRRWQNDPLLAMEASRRDMRGPAETVAGWRSWLRPSIERPARSSPSAHTALQVETPGALALIAGFESPLQAGRSVVALSGDQTRSLHRLSASLLDPALAAKIQGGLAVVRDREVRSYESASVYDVGHLPLSARLSLFLSRHPGIAALTIALAISLLVWVARLRLSVLAARRLQRPRVAPSPTQTP